MSQTPEKRPTVIDPNQDDDFICMYADSKLMFNLLSQIKGKAFEGSDFIWPGLLSGQSKIDVIRQIAKSILNHCKNMDRDLKLF